MNTHDPDNHLELRQRIHDLSPWHLDIEVVPGLRTGDAASFEMTAQQNVSFVDGESPFKELLHEVFPHGLSGRSFLDIACNCGAYAFWARDIGAGRCLGFDAREHWIRQARFLAEHRRENPPIEFHVGDVMKLDEYGWGSFDVTYFGGILYHLPFPMDALRSVAAVTGELLYLTTASRPSDSVSGFVMARESPSAPMSGMYGLHWFPTGPNVVIRILEHLGFCEFRVLYNKSVEQREPDTRGPATGPRRNGRFALLASKTAGLLG
jgi:SAM-dependent methyltransferase